MSRITECRSCNSTELQLVLDLGETPLANSLLKPDEIDKPEFKAPLAVVFCNTCSLLQITHTVDPARLFSNYSYFSSFSDTMLKHSKSIADRLVSERKLGPDSLAVEVASNDGYLLQNYKQAGIPVLGIEPARNIADVAIEKGIPTLCEFFGRELGQELRASARLADVIHANNVFAHVPDINGFLAGIELALKDDGIAIIEFPYARDMIEKVEFDTIYHEHVFYFTLTAVENACSRHKLLVSDVERLPIHGGSLRVFITKCGLVSQAVINLREQEKSLKLDSMEAYNDFGDRVRGLRQELTQLLLSLKESGKTIAAYGAAAKGSTLLNFIGVGTDVLDFVADRSTVKQGFLMPGVHLPIVPPEQLVEQAPDYVLLLTWNFADEILHQQQAYRDAGGKFIIPVPSPHVIEGTASERQKVSIS